MARFNPTRGLEITHPRIERWLYHRLPRRDALLAEMEARAEKERIPIVGPLVGRLLALLAMSIGAKRVMELGSAIGYSTIWWARGVGSCGRVYYTDTEERSAREARDYCLRAGVAERVEILVGDAVESMARVKGRFDVVFCDIDKQGYPAALAAAVPRLRKGGLFVCDNTLWSGRVLGKPARGDRATAGVLALHRALARHHDLWAVTLPIRDGVTVALKR